MYWSTDEDECCDQKSAGSWPWIPPRSDGSVFTNSVFMETMKNITVMKNENWLYWDLQLKDQQGECSLLKCAKRIIALKLLPGKIGRIWIYSKLNSQHFSLFFNPLSKAVKSEPSISLKNLLYEMPWRRWFTVLCFNMLYTFKLSFF